MRKEIENCLRCKERKVNAEVKCEVNSSHTLEFKTAIVRI